jgi:SAM-dependent methyltransferase
MLYEPRQHLRSKLPAREEFATLSPDALRSELSSSADLLRKQSSTLRAFFDDPSYEDVRGGRFADGTYVLQWQDLNFLDASALITADGRTKIFPVTDRSLDQCWPFDVSLDFYSGKRVLDHCCGGGSRVVQLRGKGIEAYGFDVGLPFNAHQMSVYSTENVLHFARAHRLPFEDSSFDVVEARFGSFYYATSDDVENVLLQTQEVARVLKAGGVMRVYPVSRTVSELQPKILSLFEVVEWAAEQAVLRAKR